MAESDKLYEEIVKGYHPDIATYNRFEGLKEEECKFYMIEEDLKKKKDESKPLTDQHLQNRPLLLSHPQSATLI